MDASGLHPFRMTMQKLHRDGAKTFLTAVRPQPMKVMSESGLMSWLGERKFCADLDEALATVRQVLAEPESSATPRDATLPIWPCSLDLQFDKMLRAIVHQGDRFSDQGLPVES